MNTSRIHIRIALRVAVMMTMALLAACSGGGVDVSIQGNVNTNWPPLPTTQDGGPIVAHGKITGLGGITVNDVRYQTGAGTVTVNGVAASMSDLRQGQVVTLRGRINDDGQTGSAASVRFDANVIGPVDAIDAASKQLIVMGQTVVTDADTLYGGGIDPWTSTGIAVGTNAQISGFADASGAIRATRIEPAPANAELQVIGQVEGLDSANLLFRVNRLTVDYGNVALIDLPGGAPVNAMRVMVYGTINAGRLEAERLVAAPTLTGATGERVQAAGIVTRFASTADFDVNHVNVTADFSTAYQNGTSSELALNKELMVDGNFARNGSITAEWVTFGHFSVNTTKLTFTNRDFTEILVPTTFDVNVSQGSDFSIEVFVDSLIDNRVNVSQTGSRLTIELQPGNANVRTLEAHITMPVLDRIDLTGVSSASLYDFDQAEMTINVDGVSFLRGYDLRIDDLTADVSGVSRMDLIDIRPLGAAHIDLNGVSQATLNLAAGSTLTGSVGTGQGTGTSVLYYYGTNVNVNVATDFLSSIEWLGHTKP